MTLTEPRGAHDYATIHFGKWHLGGPNHYPKKQGFDINIGGAYIGAPGSYYHPYYREPSSLSGPVEGLPGDDPKGRYLPDRRTDEAVRLIAEQMTIRSSSTSRITASIYGLPLNG